MTSWQPNLCFLRLPASEADPRSPDAVRRLPQSLRGGGAAVRCIVTPSSPGCRIRGHPGLRNRQHSRVAELSFSDTATGSPKRALLRDRRRQLIADAVRREFRSFVTILDVDGFEIDSMWRRRGMSEKWKETARGGLAVAMRAADPEEAPGVCSRSRVGGERNMSVRGHDAG